MFPQLCQDKLSDEVTKEDQGVAESEGLGQETVWDCKLMICLDNKILELTSNKVYTAYSHV